MKNLGQERIYLTGSKKVIRRNVLTDGEKYFIKYFGSTIEVEAGVYGFVTVEEY